MSLRRPAGWVGQWPPVRKPPPGWTAERWETQMAWSILGIPPPGWSPPRSRQSVRTLKRTDPDHPVIPGLEPSHKPDRSSRDQDVRALRRGSGPDDRGGVSHADGVGVGPDHGGGLVLPEAQRQPGDAGDVHPVVPTGDRVPGQPPASPPDPGPLPSAYGPSESFCRWCGEEIRVLLGNRHFRTWATVAGRDATCPGRPFHFPVSQLRLTWWVTQADATRRPVQHRLTFDAEGRRTR